MMHISELMDKAHHLNRWHMFPNLFPQNLAAHSWGVAMIIMETFKGDIGEKMILLQAALEHDLAETEIGDMPRPGRTEEHKALEVRVSDQIGVFHESRLQPHLRTWLEWADLVEAAMHARRETLSGNKVFLEIRKRITHHLLDKQGEIPPEIFEFALRAGVMDA